MVNNRSKKGSAKFMNLIVRISTRQVDVDTELYREVDRYYLQQISHLPRWAEERLYEMLHKNTQQGV